MRRVIGVIIPLVVASVTVALATLNPGRDARSASEGELYTVGPGSIPNDRVEYAVVFGSEWICATGGLMTVQAQGATEVGNLDRLQPSTPGLAHLMTRYAEGREVYAVVTSGNCVLRTDESGDPSRVLTQGYFMFNDDGMLYVTGWTKANDPHLTEPFGPLVEAAITSME